MRRAAHSQPNNLSAPAMYYSTADSFFAETTDKPGYAKNGSMAAMTTPKRPPKLMDQRISISTKNGRRNSLQQQPEFIAGQIAPLNVVMPQLIKSQQQPRNQTQPMGSTTTTMGGRGRGTIVKETTKPMETTTTIFATPPRRTTTSTTSHRPQQQQQSSIRREHSTSIVIPSRRTLSATFMRYTPPTTIGMERGHSEVASLFAGSKSIESPSPKSLPLPPSHWLESNRQQLAKQEIVEETMAEESDAEHTATSSAEANNENFIPGTWSPPTSSTLATTNGNKSPSGIRIHPLHLISAAVMSS